ncbi:hypothetical protein CEE69_08390 [Rhodopirellula bahusiensis]|uniref:Uncharacterized protein n=1 Tax=Rhodopirellula bahusiensis TaxID=2014065 RepID=A0A2G1W9B7_9BACT|nr:hypothetical protein CEE69_08390 [Rhodopirellula bahusiensis]
MDRGLNDGVAGETMIHDGGPPPTGTIGTFSPALQSIRFALANFCGGTLRSNKLSGGFNRQNRFHRYKPALSRMECFRTPESVARLLEIRRNGTMVICVGGTHSAP